MKTLNLSTVIAKLNLDTRLQDRLSDLVYDAMGTDVVDGGDLWLYLEELATGEEWPWLNQTHWLPRRAEMAEMLFLSHPGATRVHVDA